MLGVLTVVDDVYTDVEMVEAVNEVDGDTIGLEVVVEVVAIELVLAVVV